MWTPHMVRKPNPCLSRIERPRRPRTVIKLKPQIKTGIYPILASPCRISSTTFFETTYDARGGSVGKGEADGLGAHPGLRHGDGGPGTAGAERISGRRKSDPQGAVERYPSGEDRGVRVRPLVSHATS